MSVVEKIQHYQRNIKKCNNDEDKMLHCISKLYNLPVTVQHLQDTGVGRTVNALRKYDGGVGDAAKALVAKWKAMVADEETSEGEDEDEACVPDAPESYSDNPDSPSNKEKYKADNTMEISRHRSSSSKHRYDQSTTKNEEHNMKHSSKHETKSKHNENNDSSKHLKTDSQKQKHEKNYNFKHELREGRHSNSKDIKDNHENSKKHGNKSTYNNKINKIDDNEESNKKRKLDNISNEKKKSKKRKYSDCENEKQCTGISFSMHETEVDKKTESIMKQESILTIKDKNTSNKTESKHERNKSHDKSKHSSNKQEHINDSRTKDTADKSKKKSEESEKKKIKDHHHSNKEVKSKDYHNITSNKDYSNDKNKNKKKDTESGRDKRHSKVGNSSKDSKSSKESKEKVKIKQEINSDEGIDCNSGASFAEALGMCTITPLSKKRRANSPNINSTKHTKSEFNADKRQAVVKSESLNNDTSNPCSLLAPNVKLEPLSVDLASTLPEISPNYKPLPYINPLHRREEDKDKALTDVIHVKNQRTKVYSGNKIGYTSVPTLYEMCIRVLIENIDALEFTGGVPYDIIKPVLERATPDQLFMLEHYNPYLIEDTDSLWQFHCNREFRNKQREEMETWREMYMRCLDEREAKLKTLTANIKQSLDKTVPMRSTKLAYVDNVVKPPRNVLRKQAKYGTGNSLPTSTSELKKKLIVGTGSNSATNISVPTPSMIRFKAPPTGGKKTKAPLMAKALQLIKGRYKR